MSLPYGRRPPYRSRGRLGFTRAACAVALGALISAAVLVLTPRAHSAPLDTDQEAFEYWAHHGSRVCWLLDLDPTVGGIASAGLDIFNHSNLNTQQAGLVIQLAIHYTCPNHQDLIDKYAAAQKRGELA